MVHQALKFFLVRAGISLFLMMTLGFGALYFFHEIALPNVRADDEVIKWILGFILVFLGFSVYGLVGERIFNKTLRALKGTALERKEEEIIDQFDNLIRFTFSSYFLPAKGRRWRGEVIREYADYLHSIGKDDLAALRIYLKGFLQNPRSSRFRLPLLSALKNAEKLHPAEIDLLLVMLKTETGVDKLIASHLASVFLEQKRFNRKTEPVFLAAVETGAENAKTIAQFVLPVLLAKKRADEYALKFYLSALPFRPRQEVELREIIGKGFCEGHWEAVDPELHERCGKIFNESSSDRREKILLSVKESKVTEKWKKLKLFTREDLRALQQVKFRLGIVKPGFDFLKKGFFGLARILKNLLKKIILKTLDGLILFSRSTPRFKLISLAGLAALILIGSGVWKDQPQKSADTAVAPIDSLVGLDARSKKPDVSRVYSIQVAAVTAKKQADRIVKTLRKKGVEGLYIAKTNRRAGGHWYKIRLEKFDSKRDARRFADHLINRKIIRNYFLISYTLPQP